MRKSQNLHKPISGQKIIQTNHKLACKLVSWLSSNLPVQNFFLEKNRGDETSPPRDWTVFKYSVMSRVRNFWPSTSKRRYESSKFLVWKLFLWSCLRKSYYIYRENSDMAKFWPFRTQTLPFLAKVDNFESFLPLTSKRCYESS